MVLTVIQMIILEGSDSHFEKVLMDQNGAIKE